MNQFLLPKRSIHLDFHTLPAIADVGRNFDAGKFAATLERSGVQSITVFAKCNLGCAYYPTTVGMVHPSLKFDMLGQMVDACHRLNIKVIAYFNSGLDHEQAQRHRDWCRVNSKGQVYHLPDTESFFRQMCMDTGYGDYTCAMIDEVLKAYPVDGIFLDCMLATPCYGIECVHGMKAKGVDLHDPLAAKRYTYDRLLAFSDRVMGLVNKRRAGISVIFNGLEYARQPKHVEVEVLPSGGWGYDYFPWIARYVRTLGKPYLTMTGRFNEGWGEFGGMRPAASLLFDCYNSIANGGECSIGDHMHPRGRLDKEVYRVISDTYTAISQLDEWTAGATPQVEIAILEPGLRHFPGVDFDKSSVAAAARMLSELKYQFNVVDAEADFSNYKVLILPDHVAIDSLLEGKINSFLQQGGALIGSGHAGLRPDRSGFALADYPVAYEGESSFDQSYFFVTDEIGPGVPRLPIVVYGRGIHMSAHTDATVLASQVDPYFNFKEWNWEHVAMYVPPDKTHGRPALVQRGKVCHFSFPVFNGYYHHAVVEYKKMLQICLERLLPDPIVKVRGMPSFGQATVTRNHSAYMIHLLAYVPELRGARVQVIEEAIDVHNVQVSLRGDEKKFRAAYLAPSRERLPLMQAGNYFTVTVPRINGYQMVVFE